MKSCPYCGKEYPDDTTNCSIDGELLRDNNQQPPISDEQIVEGLPNKNEPYLTFPDYRWSARDAWKCLGMFFIIRFVMGGVYFALDLHFPGFYSWRGSGFGSFSASVLYYSIGLLIAAYFARTETLASFWKGFGLDHKPSDYVWFGIVAALTIRFFGHFMMAHGWGAGVSDYDIIAFKKTIGFERYFFLLPTIILAPIFEEAIYRGFLYKAFRGSYPIVLSTILIIAWTTNTHWRYFSHSWIAALDLSTLTVVQCYLREKSDSLWDSILCHFAFNASLLLFLK
jgi:membrane protease YdiL (CAAX protease family)